MRRLAPALLLLCLAGPALAEAPREPLPPAASWRDTRPLADCSRAVLQHAQGAAARSVVQPLGALPPAWRLHAVNRQVSGCAVHPEAQKVSDRTGQLAAPRPRAR
jgi:hypothetical protein